MINPREDQIRQLLANTLAQRKARNPGYSLRAFARSLEISPSFLSEILNGKKTLGETNEDRLMRKLTPAPDTNVTPS